MGELVQVTPGLLEGPFLWQQLSKIVEQFPNPSLSDSWCSSQLHLPSRLTLALESPGPLSQPEHRSLVVTQLAAAQIPAADPRLHVGTFHGWRTESRGTGDR